MKKAALILLCFIFVLAGCSCKSDSETVSGEGYEELSESGFRRTTLYYASDEGFVVPVMKRIPWEEGIGKAALSYITESEDNNKSAALMGLKPVIPAGTECSLKIDNDGVATVDMKNLSAFETASDEAAMVTAVVNTLAEFSSIEAVKITLDGKKVSSLPLGTPAGDAMSAFNLNAENSEVAVSGEAKPVTLYFPTKSAGLNIPVTRYVSSTPSFATAVNELVNGTADSRLLSFIPEGTQLNSAYISNGTANVDFSAAFKDVEQVEGLLDAARDALYLCAAEFEDVSGINIYVDGKEYSMQSESASAPLYVNEFK